MVDQKCAEIIGDFAEQGVHLQSVVDYLAATGQEFESVQRLQAAWERGREAMVALAAHPSDANANSVLDALMDVMAEIETMLYAQRKVWLPECVA